MKITDKMRLDWMERNNFMLDNSCLSAGVEPYLDANLPEIIRRKTIRQAIDAAIKASKRGGSK